MRKVSSFISILICQQLLLLWLSLVWQRNGSGINHQCPQFETTPTYNSSINFSFTGYVHVNLIFYLNWIRNYLRIGQYPSVSRPINVISKSISDRVISFFILVIYTLNICPSKVIGILSIQIYTWELDWGVFPLFGWERNLWLGWECDEEKKKGFTWYKNFLLF